MSHSKLYVVAQMTAFPDRIETVKSLLSGLLTPTRQENGCIRYDLFQNQANPAEFTFIEEWTDKNALDEHLASPHIQDVLEKSKTLFAEGPAIHLYDPVE